MSLEEYRRDAWECVRCSNCKYVHPWNMKSQRYSKICPSNSRYLFDAYSSQGRMDIARAMIDGELAYDDSPELLDIIYKCTLCGACDAMCKFFNDLDPVSVFEELRARCVEDGRGPMPGHKPIIDSIKNYDNVWMQPRTRRKNWAKGLDVKDLSKDKAEVLYYVGCTYAYNPTLQSVAKNTVSILKKGGVDFGILGNKEACCGSPVVRVGDQKMFEQIAASNIEAFNNLGVKKVITSCAGCLSTFKSDYPKVGRMNFEVLHVVEYIDELIKENRIGLTKDVPVSVTYHDPCHLGRRSEPYIPWNGKRVKYARYEPPKELRRAINGIYEPPRDVLKSIPGLRLIEMERIREYAWCCGSGGGVKSAFPDFALWTGMERVDEAKATGAEAIVSCCPWCESNLSDAIKEDGDKIKIFDIVDLVLKAI